MYYKDILEIVKENPEGFQYFNPEIKNNPEIICNLLRDDIDIADIHLYFSDEIKDNEVVIKAAIKQSATAIKFASDRLKNDKDLIIYTYKKSYLALQYASAELRNDLDFVNHLIDINPAGIRVANKIIKSNKDIVLKAAKANIEYLRVLITVSDLIYNKDFLYELKNIQNIDNIRPFNLRTTIIENLQKFEREDDLYKNMENKTKSKSKPKI